MQAMYDLVGRQDQEIFDTQVVDIGLYDLEREIVSYPYAIERGARLPAERCAVHEADPRAHQDA